MRSMTGFGTGAAPLGQGGLFVELKSLNHRCLDIRVRLPAELSEYAFTVEQLGRTLLVRGRFDVSVRVSGSALSPPRLSLPHARALFRELSALRDELAPGTPLSVEILATVPAIYVRCDETDDALVRAAIEVAFRTACRTLEEMRDQEGANLASELGNLLDKAMSLAERCAGRAKQSLALYRDKLCERAARLQRDTGVAVEAGRLEQELSLLADRSDVAEEITRLSSHFAQFSTLLRSQEPIGRRLDFLLQEISRETNTLGAKSQDAELSHLVVELKAECERMREQVQNVE
jgi:uncharacterized protein (TIGR00255 family)